ncbi:SDR family NAD(P)-dependent oxidoreductase [Streptomyces sp. NPDC047813]|uniref:type I polyketide synthase n=1 Tax=Streptomyces sp. NPDC047813 TaxID=3154608 RepID=UPI0034049802
MSASESEPIAVVGMGARFPGGVETPSQLWRLAAAGHSTVRPIPAERWNARYLAALHDPDLKASAAQGCFLDADVWAWEPEALAVAPAERDWVDPQSRLMMEVAWEAVEHAGIPMGEMRGSRTGVYIGTYAYDNLFREERPVEDSPNSAYLFGNFSGSTAGRVAFAMDLRGPVMVVGTHCSSGLVALDTACGALTLGECDMALAGGVLLMLAPQTHYFEAPLLLSPSGACHAFDARADGYVRGEGAGALLLKRLTDARRDGDRVLAVIRGSAVNNDGQSTRLTAPSTEMQQALFRVAVERAGVDPGSVGLVEAHGPGTAVGDPVEYTSINAVYGRGRGRCALGSVKTNIGHCEPVSGIAGIIKAVECLRRGSIPPNQHFENWNPGIDRTAPSRLFVPTQLTPWPVQGGLRTAAVCSYGVSGTNAHVLLEQATVPPAARRGGSGLPANRRPDSAPRLYTLSGSSPESLRTAASRLAAWLAGEGREVSAGDLAHTLAVRRQHADHRLGLVARDVRHLRALTAGYAEAGEAGEEDTLVTGTPYLDPRHPGPVFVFTGQGSQHPGMCRELLATETVFASAIEELEPLVGAETGLSLRRLIEGPEPLTGVDRIQPVLFAIQVALAALWRSWGVRPVAVIGQSLGEIAAAVVAGVLPPKEGVKVICRRARLLARIARGAMASVLLGAEETRAELVAAGADDVSVAVVTAPGSTVVSGDTEQVRSLVQSWADRGLVARMIDVDVASHSPQVDPVLDDLRASLADLAVSHGELRFYSTVTDDPREPGPLDARYWARNQRDTVRFRRAVEAALADGHRLFVECTAHPLASRAVLETAAAAGYSEVAAIGSLRRGVSDQEAFLTHVAALYTAGHGDVDLTSRYGRGALVDAPTTAWHRTRHGGERDPYTLVDPTLPAAGQHPLLGGHVHDPEHPGRHLWQTPMGPGRLPWLNDHRVAGVPVLPGTAYADILLAAAAEVCGTPDVQVTGLRIDAPLVLDPEPLVTTKIREAEGELRAEVVSTADGASMVHAHGRVGRVTQDDRPEPVAPSRLSPEGWRDVDPAAVHRVFRERHDVLHGQAFTAIDRIHVDPEGGRAVAALRLHESARVSMWTTVLHPALADQVVQVAVSAWLTHHVLVPGPVVVTGFDRVRVHGPVAHVRRAVVELREADELSCTARAQLTSADGTVLAEIDGLRVRNVAPPDQVYADRLSHLTTAGAPVSEGRPRSVAGSWAVLAVCGDGSWPAELARTLDEETDACRLMTHGSVPGRPDFLDGLEGLVLAVDGASRGDNGRAAGTGEAAHARKVIKAAAELLRLITRCERPPRLWAVAPAGQNELTVAALGGLLRSAAYELPAARPSSILFDPDSTPVRAVVAELLDSEQPLTEVELTTGGRRTVRVAPGAPSDGQGGKAETGISTGHPVIEDGCYLVTGGLGGLGLRTVGWLARSGAGRVVVLGRTTPDDETRSRLAAIQSSGTEIIVLAGDVAEEAALDRALDAARAGNHRLNGIVHAAGVVEDATFATLDTPLLDRVWRGKAEGAWALHRATLGDRLDFFVLYSSVAALVGSPGQGAYAAANAFLDGLATHRRALGLPATSVQWGPWREVGRGQHLAERGFLTIRPEDGTEALERILAAGHARIAYSPLDLDLWTRSYPAVRASALLAGMLSGSREPQDSAPARRRILGCSDPAERRALLLQLVIDTVRELLGGTTRHIGPHTGMVALGLDSLGAVQLQQRLHQALGTELKPGVIWVKSSPAALSDWLLEHIGLTTADESRPQDSGAPHNSDPSFTQGS